MAPTHTTGIWRESPFEQADQRQMRLYRRVCPELSFFELRCEIRETEPLRLKRAFVDYYALEALHRLVTGPIRSWRDLHSVELSLRAFIFHDLVHVVAPAFQMYSINDVSQRLIFSTGTMSSPYDYIKYRHEPQPTISSLSTLLRDAQTKCQTVTSDYQLVTFSDDSLENEHLTEFRHRSTSNVMSAKRIDEIAPGGFYLSQDSGWLELLLEDRETYFTNIFYKSPDLMRCFLRELAPLGSPFYIGRPALRGLIDRNPGNMGGAFFKSIDESWNQMMEAWARRGLDIPIECMTKIVLSRSRTRSAIPSVILELRQEFENARKELWAMFDDALLREASEGAVERAISRIEREAVDIIPASFKATEFWFPIRFLWKFVSASNLWGGLIGGLNDWDFGRGLGFTFHQVDAARLLRDELTRSERLLTLLARHFTDSELKSLEVEYCTGPFRGL